MAALVGAKVNQVKCQRVSGNKVVVVHEKPEADCASDCSASAIISLAASLIRKLVGPGEARSTDAAMLFQ